MYPYDERDRSLPLHPKKALPVFPQKSWKILDEGGVKKLCRVFTFEDLQSRNFFLKSLLDYEIRVNHWAQVLIDNNLKLCVKLYTKDINNVTELDKEFASFLNTSFKESSYLSITPAGETSGIIDAYDLLDWESDE